MSMLRWIGLFVGLTISVIAFGRFRRSLMRRLDFSLSILVGASLIVMSLIPDSVNILRSIIALEDQQFSRLIAVSIVSNMLLWLLLIYTRGQSARRDDQFDGLIRRMGVQQFDERYGVDLKLTPIVVVIPAYNEGECISHVLEAMPREVLGRPIQTIVVDDGSSDGTAEVASDAGALVVSSLVNRGGGAALRMGFDVARRHGAETIVTMDADGQHLPSEIEHLVRPILEDEHDFVIGSRILGNRERDSVVRYLGIRIFNAVIRVLTSLKITDCSNGFRALRVTALGKLKLHQNQYHTAELIIDAAKKGIRVGEVPVTVKRRMRGTSKKGRNVTYGLGFTRTIFKSWWR